MNVVEQLTSFFLQKPFCEKCGENLEPVEGWSGKYKCPSGCHPDHYNRGGLLA